MPAQTADDTAPIGAAEGTYLQKDRTVSVRRNGLKTITIHNRLKIEAIIRSMTPAERRDPHIIDGSRRRRISAGSGTSVQDVNRLLNQFQEMRKMMKRFTKMAGKIPFNLPPS